MESYFESQREHIFKGVQARFFACCALPLSASLSSILSFLLLYRFLTINTDTQRFSSTYLMSTAKTQRATCSSPPRPRTLTNCLHLTPSPQILQKLCGCNCAILPQRQGAFSPPHFHFQRPFVPRCCRFSASCIRWTSLAKTSASWYFPTRNKRLRGRALPPTCHATKLASGTKHCAFIRSSSCRRVGTNLVTRAVQVQGMEPDRVLPHPQREGA